ncbi:beta-hydroxyaspartate dehydratase BhcB [Salinisphaera sp.]|uniref:beta-hydroxyaspartate dehydratase BhcB n=1 Tax=Salinisphaera sp. TaxID=1914330 RepID=UPI002D77E129|nr:beta-hydroxyaspartate dehydratase BhcB [Salinisphaera sp.]HET7315649.1 pyridoxal-phosphate dependent enzyme [Salinisphaera sp.]
MTTSPATETETKRLAIPTYDDVCAAHERIAPWTHRTPVLTSQTFNDMTGADLHFKCENFQKAGAFKARGATNAVFSLSDKAAEHGVATHSSGNHALSLSRAAQCRGIPCQVVMPHTAPKAKMEAVRGYGGEITPCEPSLSDRERTLDGVIEQSGAHFVHPYNDPRVIAGQGTCSKEFMDQVGGLDAVIAPIGGGGMISGSALTCSTIAPNTRVYAAEPAQADDAYRSFHAGRIIPDDAPDTIADGLRVSLKPYTWHFVSHYVTDVLRVSEGEIVDAMRLVWKRMKIVIEPSSAVAVAAVLKNPGLFAGQRVGVILTGGNVDLDNLPWMHDNR